MQGIAARLTALLCISLASALASFAQQNKDAGTQNMPGMTAAEMANMPGMEPQNFLEEILAHDTSGTSAEPDSTPAPMLMTKKGAWTLMFHANVFVLDEQQSSAARRRQILLDELVHGHGAARLGPGIFTARAMLSLEPATITGRTLPAAFPAGRDGLRQPHRRRPASAQFRHGARRALRPEARRERTALLLRRAGRRSRARPDRVPAPRVGGGRSGRRRSAIIRRIRRTSRTTSSPSGSRTASRESRRPAFTAASRANIAGTSIRARSIRGPRG